VLLDGEPAKACTTLAVSVEGRAVTTIEGLRGADGVSLQLGPYGSKPLDQVRAIL
jgi:aerobic-type carbon monoxide dehydrogenase small subunit (CoxS/CutS family)